MPLSSSPIGTSRSCKQVGRLGHADEIADTVLWLCSDRASLVVGHSLAVDGGYTIR